MAITKPEPIATVQVASWTTTTTPKETGELSTQVGDVLVAMAEIGDDISSPTLAVSGGGLTWVKQKELFTASNTPMTVWTAVATEGTALEPKKFKVTFTRGGGVVEWGGMVRQWRKCSGIGAVAGINNLTGAPSLAITTEKEHSAIEVFVGDWNAVLGAPTYRTGAGAFTQTVHIEISGQYCTYAGFHADAEGAGAKTVGLTAPTGEKYTMIAIEMKGEETGITNNDSGSGTITVSGTKTESYAHKDSSTGTLTVSGSKTESYSASDTRSGTITLSGSGTESYAHNDSRPGTITLSGTKTESPAYSDSRSGTITLSGTRVEGTEASDIRSGTVTISGTKAENRTVNDAGSGTITLSGSKVESFMHNDSRSGTITLSGTGVESMVRNDARSGTITLSGSGVESTSVAFSDHGTGTITLIGSSTQSVVTNDARSGTILLSGERVESCTFTDHGTVTITISGTGEESHATGANDSGEGTIFIEGSVVEETILTVFKDAGGGVIHIEGSGIEHVGRERTFLADPPSELILAISPRLAANSMPLASDPTTLGFQANGSTLGLDPGITTLGLDNS